MATNPAGADPAYGGISNAPGRRDQAQTIQTIASETSAGITAATTVAQAHEAIAAIAIADRAVTTTSIGRATSVETVQGKILTLKDRVGGSAYTTGTYNAKPLTGGTGTGATANFVVSGGAITTVTLVNGGSGYNVDEVLSVSNTQVGGTGSGFSIKVATTTGPINA